MKLPFSDKWIEQLAATPGKQQFFYWDALAPYLALRVTKGSKTFLVYRSHRGKPVKRRIGSFPEVGVDLARSRAREINRAIESDTPANFAPTVGDLWSYYLEDYAKPRLKTWRNLERCYQAYFGRFVDREVADVSRLQIQQWHNHLADRHGKTTANRALELFRSIFNRAQDWELITCQNPAARIRRFQLQPRERYLKADEVGVFFDALSRLRNPVARDVILFALFTGQRKTNVLEARWDQIDEKRGTWRIPQTKNGTSHNVPLCSFAAEILKRRRDAAGKSPYVFPGNGARGHITRIDKTWQRFRKDSGLVDFRLHDLRRTLASWQAATGASLVIIGRTLNHADPQSTAIYARLDVDPVRAAMEKALSALHESA